MTTRHASSVWWYEPQERTLRIKEYTIMLYLFIVDIFYVLFTSHDWLDGDVTCGHECPPFFVRMAA